MRRGRGGRLLTAVVLSVVGSAALAVPAQGAIVSRSTEVTATPDTQSLTVQGPVSLQLGVEAAWNSYSPPSSYMEHVTFHLDEAFELSFAGSPTCDPASLAGTSTAGAEAACGPAKIGAGSGGANGPAGAATAVITVFNGTPVSGSPAVLLHVREGAPYNETNVLTGIVGPSSQGYGQEIDFDLPVLSSDRVFTRLGWSLDGVATAHCPDADRTWRNRVEVLFLDGPAAGTESSSLTSFPQQPCRTYRVLSVSTVGSGKVMGTGISCPGDCFEAVAEDALVTLHAWPGPGMWFSSWGGACGGTGTVCAVTMDTERSVSASFVPAPQLAADSRKSKQKKKKKKKRKKKKR